MKTKTCFLTFLLSTILCAMQMMAAAIPDEFIGDGKWVTLKTENGYYFCAIKEGGTYKLGQSTAAPTASNYAAYCWKISGNETDGYSFRCLGYMDYNSSMDYSKANDPGEELFITNPTTIATNSQEVLLSTTGSRYNFTDNHQLELKTNAGIYIAFYSRNYHTIRLHNSANYTGSKMVIGGIYDWSVAAVVYGTETDGPDGIPQGTYLPDGGIIYNGTTYKHGSSLRLENISSGINIINLDGYTRSTIKIDEQNHYIVAYYVGNDSHIIYKNAPDPVAGQNAVTGESNTIWTMTASKYITNTSGKYTEVPADKAWQMEMVVENTNTSGNDPSFNKWGSCILASCGDPINTYYWGHFQVYQHAPTHSSPNTLNFKSSKGDGMDHIIAQGASVENRNYKVIVRYNAKGIYVIRTIMLDGSLNETNEIYNNVWVSALQQVAINQMSCALPTGINLKSLKISIAEESNLLEGVDYAIQNIGMKDYLTGGSNEEDAWHSAYAGDAAKFQIEWTGIQDLTYTDTDGGLHHSFYIKLTDPKGNPKYLGANNTNVDSKDDAQPYIYSTNQMVQPIDKTTKTLGTAWTIGDNNTWDFDFFANFYVEVAGNNSGGLLYQKAGSQQTATNGQYIELPSGVLVSQMANSSQLGYSAAISKADIRLKVQYTALDNTFYNITAKAGSPTVLYYWYKPQNRLITYSTTNSQSGKYQEWGDYGDCSKYTIAKAPSIPMKLSAADGKYYGSICCPNAITLPSGVQAYRLDREEEHDFILKPISGNVLAAETAAVLIGSTDASGDWTIDMSDHRTMTERNLFSGVFEDTANPGSGQQARSTVYVLGNKSGIGFYPYSGANIPAFKAYHTVAQPASTAPARFNFLFYEDDAPTGIRTCQPSDLQSTTYRDIMGRKVESPVRGHLYIINGKKIIY